MTIGLAAICADDEGFQRIVVASDRMVTYPGFIEFEHTVPKMTPASSHAITMISGDALIGTKLARETAAAIASTNPPLAQIAQQLAVNYQATRNQWVETQVLARRGMTFQSYYQGHAGYNGQITVLIDQTMMQFDLQLELLLVGVDASGAHLYTVHNPGHTPRQHDVIGFAAIGSGWIHAMQSMIGFRHSPNASFKETLYQIYASKRRAEVAPGVGADTDMAVISRAGIQTLTEDQLAELAGLYNTIQQESRTVLDSRLAGLRFDLQQPINPDPPEGSEQSEPNAQRNDSTDDQQST
jgi:hypothetical protein